MGDVGIWEGKVISIRVVKYVVVNLGLEKCGFCMLEVGKFRV